MTKLLTALHLSDPASLKRALTAALSAMALLAINPVLVKWNIPPISDAVIASVAGVIAVFILQSGLKSRAIAVASLGAPKTTDSAPPSTTTPPDKVVTEPDVPAVTVPTP